MWESKTQHSCPQSTYNSNLCVICVHHLKCFLQKQRQLKKILTRTSEKTCCICILNVTVTISKNALKGLAAAFVKLKLHYKLYIVPVMYLLNNLTFGTLLNGASPFNCYNDSLMYSIIARLVLT